MGENDGISLNSRRQDARTLFRMLFAPHLQQPDREGHLDLVPDEEAIFRDFDKIGRAHV